MPLETENKSNQPTNTGKVILHDVISGASVGALSAAIFYPCESMKKKIQSGQPWPKTPMGLYRGGSAYICSIMPTTTLQVCTDGALKRLGPDQTSTQWDLTSSLLSGSVGAFVSTPVENIILTQQLNKLGPLAALTHLTQTSYTRPWRGLQSLAFREATFGCFMLSGADALNTWVKARTDSQYVIGASNIGLGLVGAAFSHPFDTTATVMQKSAQPQGMLKTMKDIYKQDKLPGFYKGFLFRAGLFTGCMITMSTLKKKVEEKLEEIDPTKPKMRS